MSKWNWLSLPFVHAIHSEQLAVHGGGMGVRDNGLLESALARPQNLHAYADPDGPSLAAEYAFGIAKNHPYIDGNKRTAFVAATAFLELNGYRFHASEVDAALTFIQLASGNLTVEELAAWLRANCTAEPK